MIRRVFRVQFSRSRMKTSSTGSKRSYTPTLFPPSDTRSTTSEQTVPLPFAKWSKHGLGHLLNPIDPESESRDWIKQIWVSLLKIPSGPQFEQRRALLANWGEK